VRRRDYEWRSKHARGVFAERCFVMGLVENQYVLREAKGPEAWAREGVTGVRPSPVDMQAWAVLDPTRELPPCPPRQASSCFVLPVDILSALPLFRI
jgi:hypothetical protein